VVVAYRELPDLRLSPALIDISLVKGLAAFSAASFTVHISALVLLRVDPMIAQIHLTTMAGKAHPAMEQPNDTQINANETAPGRMSLVQHSLGDHKPTKKAVEALACNDTTVIVTTNVIPSSPSLAMISKVTQSLSHLRSFCPKSQLIIAVDGMREKFRPQHNNVILLNVLDDRTNRAKTKRDKIKRSLIRKLFGNKTI
jgi:hypothetical protein